MLMNLIWSVRMYAYIKILTWEHYYAQLLYATLNIRFNFKSVLSTNRTYVTFQVTASLLWNSRDRILLCIAPATQDLWVLLLQTPDWLELQGCIAVLVLVSLYNREPGPDFDLHLYKIYHATQQGKSIHFYKE